MKSNRIKKSERLVPFRIQKSSMSKQLRNYVLAQSKMLNKSEGEIIVELAMRSLCK